jgi:hypothetical protein
MFKKYVIVKQFLGGEWVELIQIEVEAGSNPTAEEITESIEQLKNMIFDSDSHNIVTETEAVIFSRKDGPIRIEFKG